MGLKELPEANTPLEHTHIYFGHCYKVRQRYKNEKERVCVCGVCVACTRSSDQARRRKRSATD